MSRNLQELDAYINDLPDYADQFANMMYKVLHEYKDKCTNTYRGRFVSLCVLHKQKNATWFVKCINNLL